MKDYSNLDEITVKSQAELDDIPEDFAGRIYIEFGTWNNRAVVTKRYRRSVEAWENSSVVARGNSSVEARENSSVEARGNSSVEAWENSSVVADGNAQITDRLDDGRIQIAGNARIVHMPKTIDEYCSFYGINHTKKKGTFYKAVHKRDDRYFSDYSYASKLEYVIGKKATADGLCTAIECGCGIHIAHLSWALDYGKNWDDLAILEVEADLDKIIVPVNGNGKVRCAEVKVIREVSLEECGVYGKILSKRHKENDNA